MKMPKHRRCLLSTLLLCVLSLYPRQILADQNPAPAPSQPHSRLSLQPGDAIHVSTLPDTSFIGGIYTIDGHGRVYLPIIGHLQVTGLSESQIEAVLKEHYIQYLRQGIVQVRPLVRITLAGGFVRPGLHYIEPSASLWDVVRLGGGAIREDGLQRMRWERNHEVVSRNLVPILQEGKSLDQIEFQSGDRLFVTARPKNYFRDVLRSDVLPIVTATTSILLTSLTLYRFYETGR